MRIALCQLNPVVGAIESNAQMIIDATVEARSLGADLAVFSEATISGYPAEDLWLKPHFLERCELALAQIAQHTQLPCLVGLPRVSEHELARGGVVQNVAAYVAGGAIEATYAKQQLPNYAVFDEHRWFTPGSEPLVVLVPVAGGEPVPVGVTICEDAWVEEGPVPQSVRAGAQVVVNLSASPWRIDRTRDREQIVAARAREAGVPVLLCNQVGGQDELVFDGHSIAAAADGTIIARGAEFATDMLLVDTAATTAAPRASGDVDAEAWAGLQLGLGDYVRKNGFTGALVGLSGGIDSALVLALAVDALGADNVVAVTMPSRFSSSGTLGDAHAQAARLGVQIHELAIEPIVAAFEDALREPFAGRDRDVTEENLQARVRGTLLMALSNKLGHIVLATGNKSELAVGYATLYGDMNGGFAPIKDVFKSRVTRLARWRNERAIAAGEAPVIPPSVIDRPPTAELREEQLDSDSLPPYDQLDGMLTLLIDQDQSVEQAIAAGYDADDVSRVQRLLDRAEYKRRQSAPGVRVSDKAFGRDRRVPITSAFDGRSKIVTDLARSRHDSAVSTRDT